MEEESLNNLDEQGVNKANSSSSSLKQNIVDPTSKYKSRKGSSAVKNGDSPKNKGAGIGGTLGNGARKLGSNVRNQVANQALNKVSNLLPALKAATMLNNARNARKNGVVGGKKEGTSFAGGERDESSSTKSDDIHSGGTDSDVTSDNETESNSSSPLNFITGGSKFKSKYRLFGTIPLKIKLAIFAAGTFIFIFFIALIPTMFVSAFDSLLELDDGGSSGSSSSSNVEAGSYVSWAINIANDDSHGYSQCNRLGPDYDCSSLVWASLLHSGYEMSEIGAYPFSTANEAQVLTRIGFSRYRYNESELQAGDILWRSRHTGIYIGDGKIVEASIAETGGKCGRTGDQTGKEIAVKNNGGRWTYYFRKEG